MNDEEVAIRIVRLYFEEVARLGFKRQLDLDQIITSYFYTLNKLKDKDAAVRKIVAQMKKDAEAAEARTVTTTQTTETKVMTPVVKEVTTTTVTTDKSTSNTTATPKTKSVTEIIEEK